METETVTIDDPAVRPLIDTYLARRRAELVAITEALQTGDFAALRLIGHNLHGSGGAYGLDRLSEFGARLEKAAVAGDLDESNAVLQGLQGFLARLVIR